MQGRQKGDRERENIERHKGGSALRFAGTEFIPLSIKRRHFINYVYRYIFLKK